MKRVKIAVEERFIVGVYGRAMKEEFRLSEQITARDFLKKIVGFLEIRDFMDAKEDKKCFVRLYLEEENLFRSTVAELCRQLYIEEKTLYRCRKYYVRLIAHLIEKYRILYITDKNCPV